MEMRIKGRRTSNRVIVATLASCLSCASSGGLLDVDDDGRDDALTDGVLIIRHLFDFSGPALTSGALAPAALRSPAAVTAFLGGIEHRLDVDGDGNVDALTDGVLLARYLFGLRSAALTEAAIAPGAQNRTPEAVERVLAALRQARLLPAALHFAAPRNFVTCEVPSQILPMDLDDDADTDVAVLCGNVLSGYRLQLFENPGDGTLVLHSTLSVPSANRLVAADMNLDGRTDLAQVRTIGTLSGELSVLTRGQPFTFVRRTFALPFPASHLCAGDFDAVNGPDLAIGDDLPGPRAYLYLADGSGGFVAQGDYATESDLRDVDGDGIPDVQKPISLQHCVGADLDGDGAEDLVLTNAIQRLASKSSSSISVLTSNVVALRNLGGRFGPYRVLLDGFGETLGIADMDGDGDSDVVTTGLSVGGPDRDDVILLRNRGDGSFATAERFASGGGADAIGGLALTDMDRDGDYDVGVMLFGPLGGNVNDHPTDHWALLRNDGGGRFPQPEIHAAGADILDLTFSELDAQAGPDVLAAAGDDDRVTVYYNAGGVYPMPSVVDITDARATISGTTPIGIASGDLDNDGRVDLAIIADHSRLTDGLSDTLITLAGQTGGIAATATITDLSYDGATAIYVDDVVGSGADDVAIAFLGSSLLGSPEGVGLYRGTDGGPLQPATFTPLDGAPTDLAALDVDGNGTGDLALLRYRDAGITAGVGIVAVSETQAPSLLGDLLLGSDDVMQFDFRLPEVIATADMNGDALRDIIAVSTELSNRIVSIFINNGNLSFDLVWEGSAGNLPATDVIGIDVNADGLSDVVLTTSGTLENGGNGALIVFPNIGGGALGAGVAYDVGSGPTGAVAADVDGFPGIDLMVANDGSNEMTLLINDGSGLFPAQARYLTGGGTDDLAAADLNQDGATDVAVIHDNHLVDRHCANVTVLEGR